MKNRGSLRSRLFKNGLSLAIKAANAMHRAGPLVLLSVLLLSLGTIYLATTTLADSALWSRVLGRLVSLPARNTKASPETQTPANGSSAYTLTSFDAPGAGTGELQGTFVLGINASGVITGVYSNAMGVTHAFIRAADGTFTTFDAPDAGSTSPGFEGTIPSSINANGDVAGVYIDANHAYHGFVRSAADGTITEFDAPGASTAANRGTAPLAINDSGQVVGVYTTGALGTPSTDYGFLRAADGTITTLTEPDAGSGENARGDKQGTEAIAINDSGEITGQYIDSDNIAHGFVLSASGVYTSFDPPGSTTTNPSEPTGTIPSRIDAAGDVTGNYTDSSGVRHGFVRTASGAITSFDVPGAGVNSGSFVNGTAPLSIDPGGNYVAGVYTDSSGVGHGFIYSQPLTANGAFTTFDAPGAAAIAGSPLSGTGGFSVNASGVISGVYSDSSGVLHGLLLTPNPPAATPTFSLAAGTYTSAQTVTISDVTSGATIYYTTDGTTPTTGSTVYSGAITVSSSETIEAIATATGYSASAVASASYTINIPTNPVPVITGLSPAFTAASGSGFTLTVSGSGFVSGSTIYWGSTALSTSFVSATQLTAQVPATDIASSGTSAVTVQTPSPGGGTSNTLMFAIDSGGSSSAPTFTTLTATVTPGSTANYSVTLPSSATNVTVACLNLPTGATCSYSATTGMLTITTSATTPAGTYQITAVFTETLPGAATGLIVLPLLLLPLAWARRRWMRHHLWITACLGLLLIAGVMAMGCGGSSTSSGGGSTTPQSSTVTSSGSIMLIVS